MIKILKVLSPSLLTEFEVGKNASIYSNAIYIKVKTITKNKEENSYTVSFSDGGSIDIENCPVIAIKSKQGKD